ncbi:hypothetical protein [Rhodococcus sp. T7]|uniref:hypothetical protein n=1 Tax=Rhodococcus sp. T7 TaxID=627444 RepID=UPI0013587DEE|nr:hypothetical protein [Rhodococcus sp. T7]
MTRPGPDIAGGRLCVAAARTAANARRSNPDAGAALGTRAQTSLPTQIVQYP